MTVKQRAVAFVYPKVEEFSDYYDSEAFNNIVRHANWELHEQTRIPVYEIDVNERDGGSNKWNTSEFSAEVAELTDSIRNSEEPFFVSILVWACIDGTYKVLDGHHRLLAVKRLRWKHIPCTIIGPIRQAASN
jgi:hypothetical protein